jgi:putative ABC transport system substrate-binding protein
MIRRRKFITLLGGAAALPLAARAQQRVMPVIGFLSPESDDDDYKNFIVPFLQGLKETGYIEGQHVGVEYRYARNQLDRLPALAVDLVRRRVAVIVAAGTAAALVAKATTTTIPIIFSAGGDPVALGLVASLNRPGGNLTGATGLQAELAPKRLQLVHDLVPDAGRFGVLADPAFPDIQSTTADLQAAALMLGLQLVLVNTRPIAISNRRSQLFRNSMLVRSWSATVASSAGAWNKSRRWRPAMRCPRSSHTVSTPLPVA